MCSMLPWISRSSAAAAAAAVVVVVVVVVVVGTADEARG